jgi:hypothetical protein
MSIDCYLGSQWFSENQNVTHYSIIWAEKMLSITYKTDIWCRKANMYIHPSMYYIIPM